MMSTFGDDVQKAVEDARRQEQDERDQESQRRDRADAARVARSARAKELVDEIRAVFEEAVDRSDGALHLNTVASTGSCEYALEWIAPPPARTLKVTVNWSEGYVQEAWISNGSVRPATTITSTSMDADHMVSLVRKLTDHGAWKPKR